MSLTLILLTQLFKQKMDDQKNSDEVILIYHNFRGMAQGIRYILCFLNIPFSQILLKQGEPLSSLKILERKHASDNIQLPCLIDGDLLIQDSFAIIRRLCTKAKRQDLLGQNLEQRTLIRQIYYNHLLKFKQAIKILFKFGQEAANYPQKKEEIRKQAMLYYHKTSGSLIQLATLKMKKPNEKYILSHITILDFLLYEESFYQVNLFGNLEQKNCKILETINSILGTQLSNIKDKSSLYLRVLRQFKQIFETQPFYIHNKEKLQSYGVLCPAMGLHSRQSFRKIWLGPEFFSK